MTIGIGSDINIDDFIDMMPSTVTIEPFILRDSYGQAQYGAATSYKARINFVQHFLRTPTLEIITARGTIWMACAVEVAPNSRVTLEDGSHPVILNSNAETDETGNILYVRLDFGN